MHDAIVVGAGLFGQIITKALRAQGRDVLLLDGKRRLAGSGPAACLMKPSWFSSLGKRVYDPSLRLLDDIYGIQELEFDLRPKVLKQARIARIARCLVSWVDPSEILGPVAHYAQVESVGPGWVQTPAARLEAKLVIVAAGIWTERLLPQYPQVGQRGIAFLWTGLCLARPFIQPWAPYRQLVAFNRGDGIWVGDGISIKMENWTDERERQSLERCREALDIATMRKGHKPKGEGLFHRAVPIVLHGIRPYAKGHSPCLIEEVSPGLWVASGGAKNGTLAAGYCAHVIRERTS